MKKNVFVILLAAVLLLNLFGCSVVSDSNMTIGHPTTTDANLTTVPATTEEPLPWLPYNSITYLNSSTRENPNHTYQITRQVLPEKLDNPDDLPILKWVCMVDSPTNPGGKPWNEAAVVEFNQMLADKNLPYRVQFVLLSVSGYVYPWDWSTNPKIQKELEDADLIFGNYSALEMEQWLMPITDHIYGDAQSTLAGALPDPLSWFSVEANGEIYGIPRNVNTTGRPGWAVDPDFMKQYGLTVEDFQKNFWEMDELFAELYEKNDNQPLISSQMAYTHGGIILPNAAQSDLPISPAFVYSDYQGICLNLSIDLQAEKPTVVNVLETDYFAKIHDAALRYQEAGYMAWPESSTPFPIQYGETINSSEPYMATFDNRYMIPVEPRILPELSFVQMTGISVKSAHSEKALSLLEQIITDDALRMQLCYGKEGRDYTLKDGVYSLITQKDGSRYYMDFLSPQALFFNFASVDEETEWLVRSTSNTLLPKCDGMSRLESYKADLAGATVSYCPIMFDLSELDPELSAMTEVLRTYYPMFGHPERYLEEYFQRMLRDLNEAGMQTVITELQRQLDAWIAEYPDWNPLERS